MTWNNFPLFSNPFSTVMFSHRAARVETAARRLVNWAGHITLQDDVAAKTVPGQFTKLSGGASAGSWNSLGIAVTLCITDPGSNQNPIKKTRLFSSLFFYFSDMI